jgi:CheY-like chemotaxis protein
VSVKSHILVVDDSGFARRTLRQMLEAGGHSVDDAQNGTEALDRYAARRPDLVLLDMVMEEMNGLEVLAKLRQVDPLAKVLVVSADIQTSTSQEARASGASGMLNKPFQKDQLLATVAKVASGGSAWS